MVNVGEKNDTAREATATGLIRMKPQTLSVIQRGEAAKGDVLAVARIAAIQAAKKTSDLIPLCHPLAITKVAVELACEPSEVAVRCTATVGLTGKTGVEMEALTAVQVGLLTVYDMVKAIDRGMVITDVRLLEKSGGTQRHLAGHFRIKGVARPKKKRKPIESVVKVSKTDEPMAGSRPIRSSVSGTSTPTRAPSNKFKTMAKTMTRPRRGPWGVSA